MRTDRNWQGFELDEQLYRRALDYFDDGSIQGQLKAAEIASTAKHWLHEANQQIDAEIESRKAAVAKKNRKSRR